MEPQAPSVTSSTAILITALRAEAVKRQETLKKVGMGIGALLVLKAVWGVIAARREAAREAANGDDAFRPLSASEMFDSSMKRVELKHKQLSTDVKALAEDRARLFAKEGPAMAMEDLRTVWRKESLKRHILIDELITKLLIEVDGIGVPSELVVEAVEDAQSAILAPAIDPRHRRKALIRDLHALSVALNDLQTK